MQIKATKALTNELNKLKKQTTKFKDYGFEFLKMDERNYKLNVDFDGYYTNSVDYDFKTNKFNVIKVIYPYNYYACNTYLTTKLLNKIFNKSNKTYNGFFDNLFEEVEI